MNIPTDAQIVFRFSIAVIALCIGISSIVVGRLRLRRPPTESPNGASTSERVHDKRFDRVWYVVAGVCLLTMIGAGLMAWIGWRDARRFWSLQPEQIESILVYDLEFPVLDPDVLASKHVLLKIDNPGTIERVFGMLDGSSPLPANHPEYATGYLMRLRLHNQGNANVRSQLFLVCPRFDQRLKEEIFAVLPSVGPHNTSFGAYQCKPLHAWLDSMTAGENGTR